MDQEEYIQARVDEQIGWYDRKSQRNQRIFKLLRSIEIIAAASIPFLAGHSDLPYGSWMIGFLGLLVAVLVGILSLYRFQENWTSYRTTCEALQHEKFLFLSGAEPYDQKDPFPLFVQRVESVIAKEHTGWTQYMQGSEKNKQDDGSKS